LIPSEIGRDFYLLIVFILAFECAWKTGTLLRKVRIDPGIAPILILGVEIGRAEMVVGCEGESRRDG
jgi:hypothetical protein